MRDSFWLLLNVTFYTFLPSDFINHTNAKMTNTKNITIAILKNGNATLFNPTEIDVPISEIISHNESVTASSQAIQDGRGWISLAIPITP